MRPACKKRGRPRSMGAGGRAPRYDERRTARATTKQKAPTWSDASARAVFEELQEECKLEGQGITECTRLLLLGELSDRALLMRFDRRVTPAERAVARSILDFHRTKLQKGLQDGTSTEAQAVRSFLRPLRDRNGKRTKAEELTIEPAIEGPSSFAEWVSNEPESERQRDIGRSQRILDGIAAWPLGWLKERGVICYERAAARIAAERGGRPDEAFMRSIVKTQELPTATANASDHYVIVEPGVEPRFMTVEEVARSMGLEDGSPLLDMLTSDAWLSKNQAVSCLGRAVHVGVARRIVHALIQRGILPEEGIKYASAYSGIDTFAAAVEEETGGGWEYTHASEWDDTVRKALHAAWSSRGLTLAMCYKDATSQGAVTAPTADLWVCTPECGNYSKRNHKRSAQTQHDALSGIWDSLEYVRLRRPKVVVVENVTEASVTGPLTGLLSRLKGYTLAEEELDPRDVAHAPTARTRHFWVLTRAD